MNKKYKIVKPFNGYQVGQIAEFNKSDADKYKEYLSEVKSFTPENKKAN